LNLLSSLACLFLHTIRYLVLDVFLLFLFLLFFFTLFVQSFDEWLLLRALMPAGDLSTEGLLESKCPFLCPLEPCLPPPSVEPSLDDCPTLFSLSLTPPLRCEPEDALALLSRDDPESFAPEWGEADEARPFLLSEGDREPVFLIGDFEVDALLFFKSSELDFFLPLLSGVAVVLFPRLSGVEEVLLPLRSGEREIFLLPLSGVEEVFPFRSERLRLRDRLGDLLGLRLIDRLRLM
jgi:hypothetical protein